MEKNDHQGSCICEAAIELKTLQDFIIHSRTKYFGKLLYKLVDADTIPIFLSNHEGLLKLMGYEINKKTGKKECFFTSFFRIESIDKESCCVTVSLLRPLDLHGEDVESICDVMILRRTSSCLEIDLSCICAIQSLDFDLLKRKIIIEPKW